MRRCHTAAAAVAVTSFRANPAAAAASVVSRADDDHAVGGERVRVYECVREREYACVLKDISLHVYMYSRRSRRVGVQQGLGIDEARRIVDELEQSPHVV